MIAVRYFQAVIATEALCVVIDIPPITATLTTGHHWPVAIIGSFAVACGIYGIRITLPVLRAAKSEQAAATQRTRADHIADLEKELGLS